MSNKYPEIDAIDPTKDIAIAPGEGKRPNDMMWEKDWDQIQMGVMEKIKSANQNWQTITTSSSEY